VGAPTVSGPPMGVPLEGGLFGWEGGIGWVGGIGWGGWSGVCGVGWVAHGREASSWYYRQGAVPPTPFHQHQHAQWRSCGGNELRACRLSVCRVWTWACIPFFCSQNRVGSMSWRFVTTGDCAGWLCVTASLAVAFGPCVFTQGVGAPVVLCFRRRRRRCTASRLRTRCAPK
jgi:hypothetical protein